MVVCFILTGQCSLPGISYMRGLLSLVFRKSSPVLVFVCRSLYYKKSRSNSLSCFSVMSPQHNALCSSPPPRMPKCRVFRYHIVFNNAFGELVPRQPFSNNIFISSSDTVSALFGRFPFPCIFRFFCLHFNTSFERLNS